jgi:hypothetical protein
MVMHSGTHEEGRYRVLLVGIGDNTEEKREVFCRNISEIYSISFHLLKKVVDHCPTVLKKNLPLEKAQALAKTLRSYGALVSVEEKRDSSAVTLEFQGIAPHRVALESSYLRRTEGESWNIIGRIRNISEESLTDTWVLIQLFDDFKEFLTFEEVPIPINPLPPGEASPFKIIFEGDLPVAGVTLAFKNSSGTPLSAIDRRTKKEWMEVKLDFKEEEPFPPSSFLSVEGKEETSSMELDKSSEDISKPFEAESPPVAVEEKLESDQEEGKKDFSDDPKLALGEASSEMLLEFPEKSSDLTFESMREKEIKVEKGEENVSDQGSSQWVTPPASAIGVDLPRLDLPPLQHEDIFPEGRFDGSIYEEATKLLEEISEGKLKRLKEEPPTFPWMEDFRKSIETYYQKVGDLFSLWFGGQMKRNEFSDSLHALLTILVHARFDQKNHAEKALKNTQKVFPFILRPNLLLEEIPILEGTPFFNEENWRVLFHRAIPKIHQVAKDVIERKKWNAIDLERMIQIIPHMSEKNSRMAIRWIQELIPEAVEIDFSNEPLSIGESLYRVSCRLGVVDPHFDYYQEKDSIGRLKIQAFARVAYPHYPIKIEEPMTRAGTMEEGGGGYCLPIQPRCEGCLFETFCPRLYIDFNPSEKGLKGGI